MLHLGRKYRILQELRDGKPRSAKSLSERLSLSEEAVELWLRAAYSLNIIGMVDHHYTLPRAMARLLTDEDDVRFIGGLPSYQALRSLDFELFDGFFKQGLASSGQPHSSEAFKAGTIWDHTAFLKLLLQKEAELKLMLENKAKVLDVGAGAGGWSIRLGERFQTSSFLGIDPDQRAIARGVQRVNSMGLRNVRLQVGDAQSIGGSREFNVVYLGEVLSLISSKRQALMACKRVLKKGGFIVICEGLLENGAKGRKAENQVVTSMQLDIALQGGRFFTRTALNRLMRVSGFHHLRSYEMGGGLCFLVAQKP